MNTSIAEYGAIGDGKSINTSAIQAAVDNCSKSGGGIVTVPAGIYVSGTIRLKDNVELHLEHNAVLKASSDLSDYNDEDEYPQNAGCPVEKWSGKHFIIAAERVNVAISGDGVIDGAGSVFAGGELHKISNYFWQYGYYERADDAPDRPGQMICFIECENVRVSGVTLKDSPSWNLFIHGCEYVKVYGLTIINDKCRANSDGIDIDSSRYVTVSDCIINTGDDCIAIRGSAARLKKFRKCEYVTITNCILSNSSCSVRIGVGVGEIHHVILSGLVLERSGEGITFMTDFCGRGSTKISDVNIDNIVGDDIGLPIQIFAGANRVDRISISNYRTSCKNKIVISAKDRQISDLVLRNIDIYDKEHELSVPEVAKKERGEEIMYLGGIERLVLDNVRVFARDEYFNERSKVMTLTDSNVLEKNVMLFYKNTEKTIE